MNQKKELNYREKNEMEKIDIRQSQKRKRRERGRKKVAKCTQKGQSKITLHSRAKS